MYIKHAKRPHLKFYLLLSKLNIHLMNTKYLPIYLKHVTYEILLILA